MTKQTIANQIKTATAAVEAANPHFSHQQVRDHVFFVVFGEYRGTETCRRNMALI